MFIRAAKHRIASHRHRASNLYSIRQSQCLELLKSANKYSRRRGMATATTGDQDDNLVSSPTHTIKAPSTPSRTQQANIDSDDEDSDEEEGQDEEPKLKYSRLTGSLGAVYRAGDSSSAFLVAGDKMVRHTSSSRRKASGSFNINEHLLNHV